MTVKVTGQQVFRTQLAAFGDAARESLARELVATLERTRAQVVIDINTPKENPDYVVPEGATGRRRHIPAPPGGPPNSDTGNLSARYTTEMAATRQRISGAIVAGVIYALWQEFGTRKMAARPHLFPRFNEATPDMLKRMQARLNSAAGRFNRGRK